jgi:5S rRNA maturation endonuclease (ribonuclease M5)
MQIYEDGGAKCYSCNTFFRKHEVEMRKQSPSPKSIKPYAPRISVKDIEGFRIFGFKDREIPTDICEFYNVRASVDEDGLINAHYYSYENGAKFKERKLPKTFQWIGGSSKEMFGQSLFKAGGKRLIICEGEIDTMRVQYASYLRYKRFYPVVGVQSASSVKVILENRAWVRSFQEVILMLDNDEAGQKATLEAVKYIGYDKVKVAKFPEKDADEIIKARGTEALMNVVFEAQRFIPSGIISTDDIWAALEAYNNTPAMPYPPCMDGINSKLKGMRGGEITLLIAGTGSGKSSIMREIMLHVLQTSDEMIGVVSLEESPAETARKLSGMAINRNPAKEEIPLDELRVGFDQVFGDNRVVLLDHQGSMNDTSIIDTLEYMILSGCKKLFIDHITILVSEGVDNLQGNEAQDKIMNELLRLVKRYPDVWIGLVSHLRKTPNNTKSFEEGKLPSLDDIRGCLAYGTEVLLSTGEKIRVEDVKIGMQLMGADGTPRNVLKLCRGEQQMYRVTMKTSNDSFICNAEHVLTLSHNGKVFDIKVKDFVTRSESFKTRCKQMYTAGYELPETEVLIPPYALGAWLGDGSKSAFRVMDAGDLGIADRIGRELNAIVKPPKNIKREYFNFDTGVKGEMLEKLRALGVLNNKFIPRSYILNSQRIRLELLAGLLDTDGCYNERDQAYYFYQKDEIMAKAVRDVARSVGLYSTANSRTIKSDYSSNGSLIWEVSIKGDLLRIPSQLKSKVDFRARRNDPLKRGIRVEELTADSYYGFTLDGDGRFVLGNHIITHNSGSVKQVSFDIIAFARNLSAKEELERNTIKMRVLKARFTGLTGNAIGSVYDFDTGRLRCADALPEESDQDGFTPIRTQQMARSKGNDCSQEF